MFYGGAAGGGKTDLLIGAALTEHSKTVLFRREGTQHKGIITRITEILGNRDGYSGLARQWRWNGKLLEFGSCPHLGDEIVWQGQPHDLIGFDEITHFLESQFRFLLGWNRTTSPEQRCRVICTGNPPTDSDGQWVKKFWGAWLGDKPTAEPGEILWYASIDGEDVQVDSGEPFKHKDETIYPQSRTFIPSRVQDNPFLMDTGYLSTLQGLPEPLRSQMLKGDFKAGSKDDPWQVIPTAWVENSMALWTERAQKGPMDSMGVDVARGGRDETTIARRHGTWFDELLAYPGSETIDGPAVAGLAVVHVRDKAPIHVDVIGPGTSVIDFLNTNSIHTVAINGAAKSYKTDKTEKLRFKNKRAELYWLFREALDPAQYDILLLPPDEALKMDLVAPRWSLTSQGILVESKEEIIKRIGRSPDKGDAVIYASEKTPKRMTQTDDYTDHDYGGDGWMA